MASGRPNRRAPAPVKRGHTDGRWPSWLFMEVHGGRMRDLAQLKCEVEAGRR